MSFNIGTSSTINATTAVDSIAKMDMALDDIIKTSRRSVKKTPSSSTTSGGAAHKNPNANASRATGQNKARRNAQLNARRGIASNDKPTGMEIERQVNRQQRRTTTTTGNNSNSGVPQGNAQVLVGQRGGRRQQRATRATAPSESAIRAKARNAIIRAAATGKINTTTTNTTTTTTAITAPSQQAISAAAKAMKEMGFKCPKGMMMQISFVAKPGANAASAPNNGSNQTASASRGAGGRGGGRNRSGGRGGRGGGGR